MIELIIGGVIAAVLLIWFISTWNRLVRLEKNVDQSWSNIDVLLKQRYDMIPNLVNTVKGYATHEREIFEQFALARQAAAGALAQGDVAGVASAEGMLSGLMPRINMVAEQYPELKADSNFLNLQNQITALENQIADRREFYNASATSFNTAIETIPTNIVAGVKSCTERTLFEVVGIERENVAVSF
ncbi:MAG TPA: LemA family protein [Candidatus Poseidoniaceae archaeon]|nr:MAG TPA: LemA family protein [Candidatus Poseidoniales archaeon]HIH53899.1 LemA family protein [Candidatus Poseidoniaceae archaeon]